MFAKHPIAQIDRPSTFAQMSDGALLAEIGLRQPAALAAFYDRYTGLVMAVCVHILQDSSAAETVVEDLFYKVWQHPKSEDMNDRPILTWLTSHARSLAIKQRRSQPVQSHDHGQCVTALATERHCDGLIAGIAQCAL